MRLNEVDPIRGDSDALRQGISSEPWILAQQSQNSFLGSFLGSGDSGCVFRCRLWLPPVLAPGLHSCQLPFVAGSPNR